MINISHVWTVDGLRLMGIHYEPELKNTCVLFIHGMSGNFIENYFGQILGETLVTAGIGFIYSHNRGYNHVNDIATKEKQENGGFKTVRVGATYERFEDSVFDIEAWVEETKKYGYQKIILMGHSLGCNKVIHHLFKKGSKEITGLILASPPDMVANGEEAGKSKIYDSLLVEAKKNVVENNPRKLLSQQLWDWYTLSSQTFLDLFEEFGPADNLPLMRNPEQFPELASVDIPIFVLIGEFDDIVVRTLEGDLSLIEKKATSTPSFTKKILPKANHCYEGQEKTLANEVLDWIKNKS